MNNLLSYCGLVDAKIRASDKDLPVHYIRVFIECKLFFNLDEPAQNTKISICLSFLWYFRLIFYIVETSSRKSIALIGCTVLSSDGFWADV